MDQYRQSGPSHCLGHFTLRFHKHPFPNLYVTGRPQLHRADGWLRPGYLRAEMARSVASCPWPVVHAPIDGQVPKNASANPRLATPILFAPFCPSPADSLCAPVKHAPPPRFRIPFFLGQGLVGNREQGSKSRGQVSGVRGQGAS